MTTEPSAKALEAEVAALRAEVDRLQDSLSMQLGRALIEAAKSPGGFVRTPARLAGLVRAARLRLAWRAWVVALECGLPDDPLRTATPDPAEHAGIKAAGRAAQAGAALPTSRPFVSEAGLLASRRHTELRAPVPDLPPHAARASGSGTLMVLHAGQPDVRNGYARRSHEILRALRAEGREVSAVLRPVPGGAETVIGDVRYGRLASLAPTDGLAAYVEAYADAIVRVARARPPAILHAASNHVTGMATAIAARRLGLPFVYEVRGLWEVTRTSVEPTYEGSVGYRAQREREVAVARAADRLLVNGEAIGAVFEAAGVPPERIVDVPNGCDAARLDAAAAQAEGLAARWGLRPGVPVIGFVGSLTPYEDVGTLLRACAALPADAWQLLIVGDGPSRRPLQSLASDLGLGDRAIFAGAVTADEAAAAYALIDIAPIVRADTAVARLVPPLKPFEAMAGRAALIVSDLPPLAPLAAEGRGVTVPPGRPDALAEALTRLLAPEARRALTEPARAWVEAERSWPAVAAGVGRAYDAVMG